MSILHTPERLQRRKREECPTVRQWRQYADGLLIDRFEAELAGLYAREILDDAVGYLEDQYSDEDFRAKWRRTRDDFFETFWHALPEDKR
jgi:hypothetical protein